MNITIERLAQQIARRCVDPYSDNDSLALARRINSGDGWRFEQSAAHDSVLVTENVHFHDAFLVQAHEWAIEHYAKLI